MSKILFIFVVYILVGFLSGCAGKNCVKIGGGYEGVEGGIEYCYDPVKSQALQTPVFQNESSISFLLTEQEINLISKMLDKNENGKKLSSLIEEHPISRIKKILMSKKE